MAHRTAVANVIALEAQSRAAARGAGLRYVDDHQPGFGRERKGKTFSYTDARGRRLTDEQVLARIRSLAIPPAWTDVWICPHDNGHIQSTGRDARGRKQYRYHNAWSKARDLAKHARMTDFAARLDDVRAHCQAALNTRGLSKDKILAALVRCVDLTAIRVGNEEYARENSSFGLTTLRTRHVRVRGSKIELSFRGKSGVKRHLAFSEPRLAKVFSACRALGGPHLFQYRDAHGKLHRIGSSHVNDYLRTLVGPSFSIKDFRTWSATVCVAAELQTLGPQSTERAARKTLLSAIELAAERLGNTPSICRKSYIHPLIMDAYVLGKTLPGASRPALAEGSQTYHAYEGSVRRFLMKLSREQAQPKSLSLADALRKSIAQRAKPHRNQTAARLARTRRAAGMRATHRASATSRPAARPR